ncbi:hypothetical protein [Paraburkholderia sp. BL10I2N1]|uniref:hypothetical protein n=1 Tax=Paraburkholderia sp. BL10I2N1 TaxID=1938796 RepID=UPI00105F7120|nr:hypothetical protein [Paraburkholderia sp. BL10I2N1]TDN67706.1 hypothetical protein B0G77_0994 [Paraburkholderia sp. BL10I2N1]
MTLSLKPDPSPAHVPSDCATTPVSDPSELNQQRDRQAALATVAQALDADPLDMALHRAMVEALRAAHDEVGTLAHQIALMTFDEIVAGSTDPAITALPLYNIATVYYANGEHTAAKRWYRYALSAAPPVFLDTDLG